jgi:hypothetical protein
VQGTASASGLSVEKRVVSACLGASQPLCSHLRVNHFHRKGRTQNLDMRNEFTPQWAQFTDQKLPASQLVVRVEQLEWAVIG